MSVGVAKRLVSLRRRLHTMHGIKRDDVLKQLLPCEYYRPQTTLISPFGSGKKK